MYLYRQSIILFGIVIPLLLTAGFVGGGYFAFSKMEKSFQKKQAGYKMDQLQRQAGVEVESHVLRQRPHMARWIELLSQETAGLASTNIRQITERLPSQEIQRTAFDRSTTKGGFATVTAQPASQIKLAFRGNFRTVQKAFLELETTMPQLQLQDLQISRNAAQPSQLNFQATYTAWEN